MIEAISPSAWWPTRGRRISLSELNGCSCSGNGVRREPCSRLTRAQPRHRFKSRSWMIGSRHKLTLPSSHRMIWSSHRLRLASPSIKFHTGPIGNMAIHAYILLYMAIYCHIWLYMDIYVTIYDYVLYFRCLDLYLGVWTCIWVS